MIFIIVMGVSGSGKTTIAKMLAERLGWPFYDGDDYHPPENILKMSRDIPLDDDDRRVWLARLAGLISADLNKGLSGVLACSALKQKYRDQLTIDACVKFVYLKGSYDQILERMQARKDHFMKPEMLASQFAALEEPTTALTLDISLPPAEIVARIMADFRL